MLEGGWVTELLSWHKVTIDAELSADFPAFCHFCLGCGASSARVSPWQALPRAPLQPRLVYVFPFSLPCTEMHHAQAPKPDTTCQEMLRRWGLLPVTCHSHPAFPGRAPASCQTTGGDAFSALTILYVTPCAAAHPSTPPSPWGTPC